MLGLLIKDFKLLKNQKAFFMMLIGFALFFLVINNDPIFVVAYVTFLSCLFVVSSISYDEYNNSNVFLMTLPITRKEYTIEKYTFGLLIGSCSWVLATTLTTVYSYLNMSHFQLIEWLGTCFVMLLIALIFMSIVVPVQLKFGQTKGNVAMILCMAAIAAIGFAGIKVAELFGIDIFGIIDSLSTMGSAALLVMILAFVLVCLGISYSISLQIMRRKQF
ncbi:ABC-2 transporter permease [Candidatus Stoquefichus massiliensis]|uniref:ABC-2 transporter permease n=1 Tax=Candidatus Stoquefichus massiliensis TaxID=1470350 RepID=UPI00048219FB|nr:ABC-2 transporter permease [Candidatus Stoquefichus massiliensis]